MIPLFDESGGCWGVLDLDSYERGRIHPEDVSGLTHLLRAAGLTK